MRTFMAGLAELEKALEEERTAIEVADLERLTRISDRKDELMSRMSGLAPGLTGEERAVAVTVMTRLSRLQEENRRNMHTSVDGLVAEMGVIQTGRRVLQSYGAARARPAAIYLDNVT